MRTTKQLFSSVSLEVLSSDEYEATILEESGIDREFYGEEVRLERREVLHLPSIPFVGDTGTDVSFVYSTDEEDVSLGWVSFFQQERTTWGPTELLAWTDRGHCLTINSYDKVDAYNAFVSLKVDSLHPALTDRLKKIRGNDLPQDYTPQGGWNNAQTQLAYQILTDREHRSYRPISQELQHCATPSAYEECLKAYLLRIKEELFVEYQLPDISPGFAVVEAIADVSLNAIDYSQLAASLYQTLTQLAVQ